MMTPEELLQKCVNKDRKAWDEFARRYDGLVAKSVRYKLKKYNVHISRSEYRDIVQEVFLSIWEEDKLLSVHNAACLKSWLCILSVNTTANYCRKNIFRNSIDSFSFDTGITGENPEPSLASILPSPKLNTANTLRSNELTTMIKKEISKLSPKQQLALNLNIYDGKKHKDISAIMNIPMGTVAVILKRSKERLRKKLAAILEN